MIVTTEQCRKVAQLLYKDIWATNKAEAVTQALIFLYDAAGDNDNAPLSKESEDAPLQSDVVKALSEYMKHHKLHINVISRSIGVSAYTVRTWLEGKYAPNAENSAKISKFLQNLQATPEIFQPES